MAIGSLIAFFVLLAAVALLIARPWEKDSVEPRLGVDPSVGVSVGKAQVVARTGGPSLADAVPALAPAAGGRLASAVPAPSAQESEAVGVSSAVVVGPAPAAVPIASPAPSHPEPVPVTVPVPVSAPPASEAEPTVVAEAGGGGRPTSSGRVPPRTAGTPGYPDGGASFALRDGGEYSLSLWFEVEGLAWGLPGSENLLLRVIGEGATQPSLGLQLWEGPEEPWYEEAERGLWGSGQAMGGERFLAALGEGEWHQLALVLKASSEGEGGYALFLDGAPIDVRNGVSLVEAEGGELDLGLFREGSRVIGSSEVRIAEPTLVEIAQPLPVEATAP